MSHKRTSETFRLFESPFESTELEVETFEGGEVEVRRKRINAIDRDESIRLSATQTKLLGDFISAMNAPKATKAAPRE